MYIIYFLVNLRPSNNNICILSLPQIASFCAVVIWFVIVILSGRNFKQRLLEAKAAKYHLTDKRMVYSPPNVQEIPVYPVYEFQSERGSRYM